MLDTEKLIVLRAVAEHGSIAGGRARAGLHAVRGLPADVRAGAIGRGQPADPRRQHGHRDAAGRAAARAHRTHPGRAPGGRGDPASVGGSGRADPDRHPVPGGAGDHEHGADHDPEALPASWRSRCARSPTCTAPTEVQARPPRHGDRSPRSAPRRRCPRSACASGSSAAIRCGCVRRSSIRPRRAARAAPIEQLRDEPWIVCQDNPLGTLVARVVHGGRLPAHVSRPRSRTSPPPSAWSRVGWGVTIAPELTPAASESSPSGGSRSTAWTRSATAC